MTTVLELQSFSTTSTLSDLGGTITETPSIGVGNGRFAGNGFYTPSVNDYWTKASVFAATTTIYAGFGHWYAGANSRCIRFVFTSGGGVQVAIGIDANGRLFACNGIFGTILGTASKELPPNVWNHIVFKAVIGSSGSLEIIQNGESVLTVSSVATNGSGGTTCDGYTMGNCYLGGGAGVTGYFADLWIADANLGDQRCDVIRPTAEGNSTMFAPSSGEDNALMVDDTTRDEDSTYVVSPTVNDLDTYVMSNLPSAGAVQAVKTKLRGRKTDAGARSIAPVFRIAGTDYVGSNISLGGGYSYGDQLYQTSPAGGAWDSTILDAAEFGQKVTV